MKTETVQSLGGDSTEYIKLVLINATDFSKCETTYICGKM